MEAPQEGGEHRAGTAPEAPPPPFLPTLLPPPGEERRVFLARTAATWAHIAVVLTAYVLLLTALDCGEAAFLALHPARSYTHVRAARARWALCAVCMCVSARGAQVTRWGAGRVLPLLTRSTASAPALLWPASRTSPTCHTGLHA